MASRAQDKSPGHRGFLAFVGRWPLRGAAFENLRGQAGALPGTVSYATTKGEGAIGANLGANFDEAAAGATALRCDLIWISFEAGGGAVGRVVKGLFLCPSLSGFPFASAGRWHISKSYAGYFWIGLANFHRLGNPWLVPARKICSPI